MTVGDIGKSRQLECTIAKVIEEAGYTLTDINRRWDHNKDNKGRIIIRYYDKYEPTWNFTHHVFEMPLTNEEYVDYASAGLDKIARSLREHVKNTREELYRKAYPDKYKEKEKV